MPAEMAYRGSDMSAYVLFNLFKRVWEKIICYALPRILSDFPNEFNKFSNIGARMQNYINII